MRHASFALAATLAAFAIVPLSAADIVGIFQFSRRSYDPSNPQPAAVARDGTIESAAVASGDASAGRVNLAEWSGDNQAGGRGVGGVNLALPVGTNAFLGLVKDWALQEGVEGGPSWIYYTKFQQDALMVCGFADTEASAINLSHGAGFGLEGVQPYARVLLILPWRWVQGGGSAFQTGAYNGNPPEAGLWAVPAGSSLAAVQTAPATYQLAGLDTILKQIQPHANSTSFKVQLLGGGHWQVAIDINDDGVSDYVTDDTQASNKVSPFVAMDERSGLLFSSRAAMGSKAGTVGRTSFGLSYRISPTVPEALADRRPFTVNLHATVKSSPTIIDGTTWSTAYTVSASSPTLGASPVPVAQVTGTTQWFTDLPLDPEYSTPVTFAQSGMPAATTISGSIWWAALDMYHEESATIRRGDKVKLQCIATCGGQVVKIDANGDGVIDWIGTDADACVYKYDNDGVFTSKAFNANDIQIGQSKIIVGNLKILKGAEIVVGQRSLVSIKIPSMEEYGVRSYSKGISVGTMAENKGILTVSLTASLHGDHLLSFYNKKTNASLDAFVVRAYKLTVEGKSEIVVNGHNGSGKMQVVFFPYSPKIGLTATTYANTASFGQSGPMFNVAPEDILKQVDASGTEYGLAEIPIIVPHGEWNTCFSIALWSVPVKNNNTLSATSSSPSAVGSALSNNPLICRQFISLGTKKQLTSFPGGTYNVTGATLGSLSNQLAVFSGYPGNNDAALDLKYQKDVRVHKQGQNFVAHANLVKGSITWAASNSITLPVWTDLASASAKHQTEWNRFIAALTTHENGHTKITVDAAKDIQADAGANSAPVLKAILEGLTAGNTAGTQPAAVTAAEAALDLATDPPYARAKGWHDGLQAVYDTTTSHGATQGAVLNINP